MHSYHGKSCTFIHNSDLSGSVTIAVPSSHVSSNSIEIDGQDLLNFVAEYIRLQKISRLEQASTGDLIASI